MSDPLTPEQAAEMLSVKLGTLAAWRHRRVGPPFLQLAPRSPRYRRADVDAWLKSRKVSTAP